MSRPELAVVIPAYNEASGIVPTLRALRDQNYREGVMTIVVDNNSVDGTSEVVESFAAQNDGFPLEVIVESEKGTGRAADAGFRYAIEQGYKLIGRTDADTLPAPNWTTRIFDNFVQKEELQLLGGNRDPRKDDGWYLRRDAVLWPLGVFVGRRLRFGDKGTGLIIGNNMATRADAYVAAGGFPHTSIDVTDEDREFERQISNLYGPGAVQLDPQMRVATSMRRLRELGYIGLARYRVSPASRENLTVVDIRSEQPAVAHAGYFDLAQAEA